MFENFKRLNIAVIGDLMLDKYIFGSVERISPEAPIPIVLVKNEKFALGGAANVAANVASLTGNAFLFGILGRDEAQEIFIDKCKKTGIQTSGIHIESTYSTIQKIRVIGQHQQLLRIDYENQNAVQPNYIEDLIFNLKSIAKIDAMIVSDYAKGAINRDLMEELKEFAKRRGIPIIVDPKPKHKDFYENVSLITPNLKEAQELSGIHVDSSESLEMCGRKLNDMFSSDIVITTGEKGMSIFPLDGIVNHIPTKATEVFDVSGAGDTVVATITMALVGGKNLHDASELANLAAGIKVKKLGTAPVTKEELESCFQS
jgi:rfaE bifunctional protein kinase chain/domain